MAHLVLSCPDGESCSEEDHPVGVIPVRLSFGGIGYYLSSTYIANYTIWGHTDLELTTFSDVVISGQNVSFEGFIKNDLEIPLDRDVKILWNGITRTTVTSFNGDFSGEFVLPYDTIAGNHTLTAMVEDENYLRGSSDSGQVLVMRETDLSVTWLGGFRNESSVVSGTLRDIAGVGVSGQELQIYFDGDLIENVLTDDLGNYNYNLFIDSDTSLGLHNVQIVFNGSYLYVGSSNEVDSDILAKTMFLNEPLEVLHTQEFILESNLVDDLGVALS